MAMAAKMEEFSRPYLNGLIAKDVVRLCFGVKSSEVDKSSICMNNRSPSSGILVEVCPPETNFLMVRSVCAVLSAGCLPQIIPSVVKSITIHVIKDFLWPLTSHPQPSKPMGHIKYPINADLDIAEVSCASRFTDIPSLSTPSSGLLHPGKPDKHPSLWSIVKDGAEILCRYVSSWRHNAQYYEHYLGVKG